LPTRSRPHMAHRVRWHSAAKREVEQKWCHSGAPPPLTIAENRLNACHVGPKCDIDRRGPSHPAQRMMVISSIWIGMGISVAESGAANR
jgi:hypothetical protein